MCSAYKHFLSLIGKIQHFNPAAVGSKENESCDVVSLGGAISSRDSLPTTDNADEIINDTLVPFSYPTVSEEVMQWLDSNGDPVTSPGLLKGVFKQCIIGVPTAFHPLLDHNYM